MENNVDTGFIGTIVIRTNAISLIILLDETDERHHNINLSHLNIQFLRIITPNNGSNTATIKYCAGMRRMFAILL